MSKKPQPKRPTQALLNAVRAPLASYSNYFEVGHNPYEFLIDFGQFQPEVAEVIVHTRIVVGPTHAKLLAQLLHGALTQYEADNGQIAELIDPPGR